MSRIHFLACATCLACTVSCTRGDAADTSSLRAAADTVEYFPNAALRETGDALATGTTTARVLLDRPGVQFVAARRVVNGMPEIHDDWADVAVVQAGRATLLTGGHVTGSQLASRGEHRGGVIEGGVKRVVTEGDLFFVPPGVPHQYLLAPGDSIRYLTIKVPRAITR